MLDHRVRELIDAASALHQLVKNKDYQEALKDDTERLSKALEAVGQLDTLWKDCMRRVREYLMVCGIVARSAEPESGESSLPNLYQKWKPVATPHGLNPGLSCNDAALKALQEYDEMVKADSAKLPAPANSEEGMRGIVPKPLLQDEEMSDPRDAIINCDGDWPGRYPGELPESKVSFERFTDRACRVMHLANQEAQRLDHEWIGTEHILIGLIKEGTGVACNVLKNMGINRDHVLKEVCDLLQPGPFKVQMGKLPRTPRVQRVLEHAIAESAALGHNYVGTEHVLLGLLSEPEGIAGRVLIGIGLTLEKVRVEILFLLGQPKPTPEAEATVSGDVASFGEPRLKRMHAMWKELAMTKLAAAEVEGKILGGEELQKDSAAPPKPEKTWRDKPPMI